MESNDKGEMSRHVQDKHVGFQMMIGDGSADKGVCSVIWEDLNSSRCLIVCCYWRHRRWVWSMEIRNLTKISGALICARIVANIFIGKLPSMDIWPNMWQDW